MHLLVTVSLLVMLGWIQRREGAFVVVERGSEREQEKWAVCLNLCLLRRFKLSTTLSE